MKAVPVVLVALALAACGKAGSKVDYHADGGQTITINDTASGNIKAELGSTAKMPTDLPSWTPAYPGSTILLSQQHDKDGKSGAFENVMLQTTDDVAKVGAFYDQQLTRAGVKSMQSVNTGDTFVRLVETPTDMISVNATKADEGGSSISISRLPK